MLRAIGILALGCAAAFGQSAITLQVPDTSPQFVCGIDGHCRATVPMSGGSGTAGTSLTWNGPPPASAAPDRVNETLKPSKTYNAAGASILLIDIPQSDSHAHATASFMVAVASKKAATHAIVEVYYWTVANLGGKDLRLLRTSRQVVGLYGDAMCLSDPFDIELAKVEKVEVRLVTETGLSEFWNHTESAGAK